MKILVLYGSHRSFGNSETLVDMVVEGVTCTKIYLRDKVIQPIIDQRHEIEGFKPILDDYDEVVSEMLKHDILIFASPIYWYGMTGRLKNFVDRWSQSLRDQELNFKENMSNKEIYLVISGGDQPRLKGLPLVQQFQYICDFFSMKFSGYIIGEGNKPEDIIKDRQALYEAKIFNEKLQLMNARQI